MKTHHIIYEVIFNNGNKSIYQYELNRDENVFSHCFDDNERVLGVEVVETEDSTDFRFYQGRVCNFGTPCSEIIRKRGRKAIKQFTQT